MNMDKIKEVVTESTLVGGAYPNTILIETNKGFMPIQIPLFAPDHPDELMKLAGRWLATNLRGIGTLLNVASISVAWMTRHSVGDFSAEDVPDPSLGPNQIEILLITTILLASRERCFAIYEIKRAGKLTDLLELEASEFDSVSFKQDILQALVDGYEEQNNHAPK